MIHLFATVRDLFETFPSAPADVGPADDRMSSLDFLRDLVKRQQWQSAISFCAFLLPRRVAVACACRSLRRMISAPTAEEQRLLEFVEARVAEPEEHHRRKAPAAGTRVNSRSPATWSALVAGWSGGSIVPGELGHVPAAPEQTAKAVRVSLFIALSRLEGEVKQRVMTACLQDGIQLAGAAGSPR